MHSSAYHWGQSWWVCHYIAVGSLCRVLAVHSGSCSTCGMSAFCQHAELEARPDVALSFMSVLECGKYLLHFSLYWLITIHSILLDHRNIRMHWPLCYFSFLPGCVMSIYALLRMRSNPLPLFTSQCDGWRALLLECKHMLWSSYWHTVCPLCAHMWQNHCSRMYLRQTDIFTIDKFPFLPMMNTFS